MDHMHRTVTHEIHLCTNADCGLRFPVVSGDARGLRCPVCGAPALTAHGPYPEHKTGQCETAGAVPAVDLLLDNIRSLYNVGSIFRTAEGAGIQRIHLCGITPTPDNPRLAKTALGAEQSVSWTFHSDGCKTAAALKGSGKRLWALEGGEGSVFLHDVLEEIPGSSLVLAVGNEISGVDPGILALCDRIVSLPMQGNKTSLNTAVAAGIAVYSIRFFAKNS